MSTLAAEFNKNTCRWALLGDAAVMRMSGQRKAILTALEEADGSIGPKKIAAAAGLKPVNVRQLLPKLLEDGAVAKDDHGRYRRVDRSPDHNPDHNRHNPLM